MAFLLICPAKDPRPWVEALHSVDPDLPVRVWPDTGDKSDIEFALVWNHPTIDWPAYTSLKALSSLGAGIDHFLKDPDVPKDIPIARIVDPELVQSMSEYVVTAALTHFRAFLNYRLNQTNAVWRPEAPRRIQDIGVGIMGMGMLGRDAAKKLRGVGFKVYGWSRRLSNSTDLDQAFAGNESLPAFLSRSDILICLLPLTSATRGILNAQTFSQLPRDAYIINVARGGHLVESALLDALQTNHIAGACLDVFEEEPLPASHPFWTHPKVLVTPHIASITNPMSAAPQVVENYQRTREGRPLLHQVNLTDEY